MSSHFCSNVGMAPTFAVLPGTVARLQNTYPLLRISMIHYSASPGYKYPEISTRISNHEVGLIPGTILKLCARLVPIKTRRLCESNNGYSDLGW